MNWLTNMLKSLGRGMGELSPSCREATRLQSEAMDRPLRLRQRVGLRLHLFLCRWCCRYGRQIGLIGKLAPRRDLEEAALPPQTLRPETKARIKVALREHQK